MPRYSPGRTLFSSSNKKLHDIPWEECHEIYEETRNQLLEEVQLRIDEEYAQEIAEKERRWTDSHEAPYEGNFSDEFNKPKAVVSMAAVEKASSVNIRKNFIEKYRLDIQKEWFMPQIITYIGNMPVVRNDNGKISGLKFRNQNFVTAKDRGIYRFLMVNERSAYLNTQYKGLDKQYCSLVPLILYAQRLVRGTDYSAWDRDELFFVVNTELADAMLCDLPAITKDQVMEQRTLGLKDAAGKDKNPVTTHMLYGNELKTGILKDVPKLARVMLTQIWCAHPDNRTRYMVLDPKNWDKMPPMLVPTTVSLDPFNHVDATKFAQDTW